MPEIEEPLMGIHPFLKWTKAVIKAHLSAKGGLRGEIGYGVHIVSMPESILHSQLVLIKSAFSMAALKDQLHRAFSLHKALFPSFFGVEGEYEEQKQCHR